MFRIRPDRLADAAHRRPAGKESGAQVRELPAESRLHQAHRQQVDLQRAVLLRVRHLHRWKRQQRWVFRLIKLFFEFLQFRVAFKGRLPETNVFFFYLDKSDHVYKWTISFNLRKKLCCWGQNKEEKINCYQKRKSTLWNYQLVRCMQTWKHFRIHAAAF